MRYTAAVHRTIVVTDIEKYTDPDRTNLDQLAIRREHYRIIRQAFARARIPWAECTTEDRGDGVLILVPSGVPKVRLAVNLPTQLDAALRRHGESCSAQTRIRLRIAIHAGEVHYDCHGVAGKAVNHTFRLAEASALKATLGTSTGALAIIASEWFYDEVIRHYPAAEPGAYVRVPAENAYPGARAWVRVGQVSMGSRNWVVPELAVNG